MSAPAAEAATIPDCKEAIRAWRYAYEKIGAGVVFHRALGKLADQTTALFDTTTDGGPFTFGAMATMPRPVHQFYSGLIDAQETLAEMLEAPMYERVMDRHPAMLLIGDALGALADRRVREWVRKCVCRDCRAAVARADQGDTGRHRDHDPR
jgi:hypothetical protein